ncbi:ATP-grasp domain-containing protein [Paenibacillus sp. N3.4]|uniref:ATP-grasp domain-containing protein n=1 Tax=Paenibacillus sp. N3.4 TaxID=2603222 RepID=UPI0016503E17|nr:ATP-grasp domain-containing protein [Paenibacillus sp. N3.4]
MITEQGNDRIKGLKVLITGGRAPAALELVRLLAAEGCQVHVAESAKKHLCIGSKAVKCWHTVPSPAQNTAGFLATLVQIIENEKIDLLIPTCEEIFYIASGLEKLQQFCRIYCAPIQQLRRLHSKWSFIRRAEELGFEVPETLLIQSPGEIIAKTDTFRDGYVLKPEFSRFAAKVRVIRHHKPPTDDLDQESYPWVAQQFISGKSICTYSVVHRGKIIAHADYEAKYAIDGGACIYFEPLFHDKAQQWVARFVGEEQFTGQIGFDFIETAEGNLFPLECNPRATSGLHLLAAEYGMADVFLKPEEVRSSVLKPGVKSRAMIALPMLLYGFKNLLSRKQKRLIWLKKLATTRDVIFRWEDRRPFFQQAAMLLEIRQMAKRRQQTLVEASTADIEWNGEVI